MERQALPVRRSPAHSAGLYSRCEQPTSVETGDGTKVASRRSSIGLFGLFGRSGDLKQLDTALRTADLHPALVPEGVKLTIVNLMKDHWRDEPPASAYPPLASLLAYCVIGPEAFGDVNGADSAMDVERRVEAALDRPDSLDAQVVLLALHAKLLNAAVVDRFGLSVDPA